MMRGFGYKQQEIADKIGVSRKTVETHLGRLWTLAENARSIDEAFWNEMIDSESLTRIIAAVIAKEERTERRL